MSAKYDTQPKRDDFVRYTSKGVAQSGFVTKVAGENVQILSAQNIKKWVSKTKVTIVQQPIDTDTVASKGCSQMTPTQQIEDSVQQKREEPFKDCRKSNRVSVVVLNRQREDRLLNKIVELEREIDALKQEKTEASHRELEFKKRIEELEDKLKEIDEPKQKNMEASNREENFEELKQTASSPEDEVKDVQLNTPPVIRLHSNELECAEVAQARKELKRRQRDELMLKKNFDIKVKVKKEVDYDKWRQIKESPIKKMLTGEIHPSAEIWSECGVQSMNDLLPAIINQIDGMPHRLRELQSAMFEALIARARENLTMAQALYWLVGGGDEIEENCGIREAVKENQDSLIKSDLFKERFMDEQCLIAIMDDIQAVPKNSSLLLSDWFASHNQKFPLRNIYDPFVCGSDAGEGSGIKAIRLLKIFSSNAKPLLVSLESFDEAVPSRAVIFKTGDDLRKDVQVLQMFRYMNFMWNDVLLKTSENYQIQAHIYSVMPVGIQCGFIELIPGVRPLSSITGDDFNRDGDDNLKDEGYLSEMIATAAAGYIAAHMMGVKDRHSDNILITEEGTCFHIDFGHVLGDAVALDTADFAITPNFKKMLGDENWRKFVGACVKAYAVLYSQKDAIIEYATMLFKPIEPAATVRSFMESRFYNGADMGTACENIKHAVEQGPEKTATRMKNIMHATAQDLKSTLGTGQQTRKFFEVRDCKIKGTMYKRGENEQAAMRKRYFALHAKGDNDAAKPSVSLNPWHLSNDVQNATGGQISSDDISNSSTGSKPVQDRVSSYPEEPDKDSSATLYYFKDADLHKQMREERLKSFKGYVNLADVTRLEIRKFPEFDIYLLVTANRTWELQATDDRKEWRSNLSKLVSSTCDQEETDETADRDFYTRKTLKTPDDTEKPKKTGFKNFAQSITGFGGFRGRSPPPRNIR